MGFAGACTPDQHKVALMIEEVTAGQITDQGIVDLGRLKAKLLQFLGQWQLGDGHLVFELTLRLSALLMGWMPPPDGIAMCHCAFGSKYRGGIHTIKFDNSSFGYALLH